MGNKTHCGRLTRSSNGYIAGICEGLGQQYGINSTIIRLIWLAAILFFGTGILLYLVLWWVVPHEDAVPVDAAIWRKLQDGRHEAPLQRTVSDRKFLGVCGGLARYWNIDPSLVRLAVLSLATMSFGLVGVAYLVVAFFIPGSHPPIRTYVHPVEF